MTVMDIADYLAETVTLVDHELDRLLPGSDVAPQRLHEAMRYAIFAGGKRIRPALARAACSACGGSDADCTTAMAAVELLHTYTLVHDDLPAMDDDDLRRGRPTVHRAYDESTAILVGDALHSLAFAAAAAVGADAVIELANAAGSLGVAGGQQDDVDSEGHPVSDAPECRAQLERIHRGKTAALIRASCEIGALAARADTELRRACADFGEACGLAFQVIDDILDTTATADELGKTPGKDAAAGKLTYVAVYGLEAARSEAERLRSEADAALAKLPQPEHLRALGHYIVQRSY